MLSLRKNVKSFKLLSQASHMQIQANLMFYESGKTSIPVRFSKSSPLFLNILFLKLEETQSTASIAGGEFLKLVFMVNSNHYYLITKKILVISDHLICYIPSIIHTFQKRRARRFPVSVNLRFKCELGENHDKFAKFVSNEGFGRGPARVEPDLNNISESGISMSLGNVGRSFFMPIGTIFPKVNFKFKLSDRWININSDLILRNVRVLQTTAGVRDDSPDVAKTRTVQLGLQFMNLIAVEKRKLLGIISYMRKLELSNIASHRIDLVPMTDISNQLTERNAIITHEHKFNTIDPNEIDQFYKDWVINSFLYALNSAFRYFFERTPKISQPKLFSSLDYNNIMGILFSFSSSRSSGWTIIGCDSSELQKLASIYSGLPRAKAGEHNRLVETFLSEFGKEIIENVYSLLGVHLDMQPPKIFSSNPPFPNILPTIPIVSILAYNDILMTVDFKFDLKGSRI